MIVSMLPLQEFQCDFLNGRVGWSAGAVCNCSLFGCLLWSRLFLLLIQHLEWWIQGFPKLGVHPRECARFLNAVCRMCCGVRPWFPILLFLV
jgi:hypothetical protein